MLRVTLVTAIWRAGWKSRAWWIAALAIAFPLLRLWPLDGQFFIDWVNHKWLAGFDGEYLRHHGTVPITMSTTREAGIPYPIFYGTLFYPALALFTSWLSPDLVIRLAVIVVTWLEFRCVSQALLRYDVSPWLARGVACIVIWATYPLTNLYHRGAIPEYVATALLTCIVATWFAMLRADSAAERRRLGLAIGLMFAFAAGTHPITALYSIPMLGLLLVSAWSEHGRDRAFWRGLVRALAAPVALVVVVLSPWLYALVKFQSSLRITIESVGGDMLFDANDTLGTRLTPVPYDSRDLSGVNAPYLDTQVNVAAIVLVIGWLVLLARHSRGAAIAGVRATAVCFVVFALFLWMSLSPTSYTLLPPLAKMLQIAYRAVTYQNLAMLVATFMIVALVRRRGERSVLESKWIAVGLLAACVGLSAIGVAIKYVHGSRSMNFRGTTSLTASEADRQAWIALPPAFYGDFAYSTPVLYGTLPPLTRKDGVGTRLPIGTNDEFGEPKPLRFALPDEMWVLTSIQAFPWNHVILDGRDVPADELSSNGLLFALRVPAGEHTLELETREDTAWLVLRDVSFVVTAAWLGLLIYLTLRRKRAPRTKRAAPARP